jgi:hypothetical protein
MRAKSERFQIERQTAHQLLLLGIAALLLSSCQIFGLRKHVETMEEFGVVAVRVSPLPTGAAATNALAWTSEKGELRSAGVHRVTTDGIAAFTLSTDRLYIIGASIDENGTGS